MPPPLTIPNESFKVDETFSCALRSVKASSVTPPSSGNSSPASSPPSEFISNAFERRQWSNELLICPECKFVSESAARFEAHFKEPRHVYYFRNMAYKEPKRRQMWLKIWFSTLEAAEEANLEAFEVDESEEDAYVVAQQKKSTKGSLRKQDSIDCLSYSIGKYKFKQ